MKIIELVINEEDEFGVQAISLVDAPAIQENWLTLKSQDLKLQAVDQDKRILIGASLVPNRPIYRTDGEEEWYVHISQETVKQVAYKFMRQGYQHNTTFQHESDLDGNVVVESWIVESETDKSYQYGLNPPVGTWMVAMHIGSQDFWEKYVKSGEVKGFSIEGRFLDAMRAEMSRSTIKSDKRYKGGKKIEMESYSDYPDAVKNNAKKGIELNEKNGNKCATQTGKVRAQQLAKGEAISLETIKRMYSYLSRAEEDYDPNDTSACGTISYLLWGGKAGLRWSRSKLAELELSEIVRELEILEAELDQACAEVGVKRSKKAPKSSK